MRRRMARAKKKVDPFESRVSDDESDDEDKLSAKRKRRNSGNSTPHSLRGSHAGGSSPCSDVDGDRSNCRARLSFSGSDEGEQGGFGTRWAARRRGPAQELWCCTQGHGAYACEARLVRAARGVQRAQQGAARALFPILSPIFCPIFGKANSREFSAQKIFNNIIHSLKLSRIRLKYSEQRAGERRPRPRAETEEGAEAHAAAWASAARLRPRRLSA
jgi:hypothetical protein